MENPAASPVPAVFSFESHAVRVIDKNGEPWFVVKDVCDVLGISDARRASERLDDDERSLAPVTDSLGRQQQTFVANESGLYSLILRSDKPEAKKFKRWVTHDVLPALRKSGSYSVTGMQHFSVPIEANLVFESYHSLALKIGFDGNQAVLSANMATRAATGVDPLQLMGATHLLAGNQNRHFTPTELGQRYHMTGREFNIALEAAGLQTKHGSQWMPSVKGRAYAVLLDTCKRKGNATPIQQLKWTADVLDVLPALKGGAQ